MGLDISVYKVTPLGSRNPQKIQDYFSIDYYTELTKLFKKLSFIKKIEYYRPDLKLEQMGHDPEKFKTQSFSLGRKAQFVMVGPDNQEVILDDIPTSISEENCIAVEEVGYQRKGANEKFYTDGMWDSRCITTRAQLVKHWNEYFSGPKEIKTKKTSSYGFGMEFKHSPEEARQNFQNNIVDKFVQGETFVVYH